MKGIRRTTDSSDTLYRRISVSMYGYHDLHRKLQHGVEARARDRETKFGPPVFVYRAFGLTTRCDLESACYKWSKKNVHLFWGEEAKNKKLGEILFKMHLRTVELEIKLGIH